MAMTEKFSLDTAGSVVAIRLHDDGSYHIGSPSRMFLFDIYSYDEFKRVCTLFGLKYETLFDLMFSADQHPNEFLFMTL